MACNGSSLFPDDEDVGSQQWLQGVVYRCLRSTRDGR